MDNSHWKLLKARLNDELLTLLAPLDSLDWNKETSRKANAILSRRAFELLSELDLPKIPQGHRMFAKLWFKASKPDASGAVKNDMCLSVYHVPWTRGKGRQTGAPRRRMVAAPLRPEDPLGVMTRLYEHVQYDCERSQYRYAEASEFLMSPALNLTDVQNGKIVEARR